MLLLIVNKLSISQNVNANMFFPLKPFSNVSSLSYAGNPESLPKGLLITLLDEIFISSYDLSIDEVIHILF